MPNSRSERLVDSTQTKVLNGWRRCLPCYVYKHRNGWKLQIFPAQFSLWSITLLVGGYLGGGTALYLNDRHRNQLEGVSWFDRVYPPNWAAYRQSRGAALIENGRTSLQEGNFSYAFHQLRAGLVRSPDDREGRILLSQMYAATDRPDLAQTLLTDGLTYHWADLGYLRQTVETLFSRQLDSEVGKVAEDVIPKLKADLGAANYLAVAKANSLYFRGQFDQSEDTLRDYELQNTPDGRLLVAKIEWDRGFRQLALALINRLATDFPANDQVYRTQVRWLIEDDQKDSARRVSLLRRIRFPDRPQPRIDLLYAYHETGDPAEVQKEAGSLLRDFSETYPVILQIGDFAANTGNPELAARIMNHADRFDMPMQGPALMLAESHIVAGQYNEALKVARETLINNPSWEDSMAPVFNGLRAICYFALGDREDANLFLNSYLELLNTRAENLVAVAERLLAVGATREARRILEHAVRNDPLNQPALTRLVEFDLDAADASELPTNVERLLTMRRTSPTILRDAYDRLGEDRFVFADNRNKLLDDLLVSLRGGSD